MLTTPFVVGAYAAETDPRDTWYRALADLEWVRGIEIPWPGDLDERAHLLGAWVPKHWDSCVITAIPGTMVRMGPDPERGLASPSAQGRGRALADMRELREGLSRLNEAVGGPVARWIHVHSAPREIASAAAFEDSLGEILSWDWSGATPVVEHCDRWVPGQAPQKGFLSVEDEVAVAATVGTGVSLNWGRSALEERRAGVVPEHVRTVVEGGALRGLMFSGAGPGDCALGAAWEDLHLPMHEDEPASAMDAAAVGESIRALSGAKPEYVGAKIQAVPGWDVEDRVAAVTRIRRAVLAGASEEMQ
ncbi:DUF4862 family protein [Schaalia sp. 19OD2882]|uniref:DUF4862 family protein n=1 Tax=Schaalia sp. 19OD2882 TaxID=2794089 RepID=UPI001C1EB911|nr:DUF4862 family protein [Schaalia sp. 19OD2882]QWW18768.1 DUF4862 family protein [Schaalia sp. 19OD2882]